MHNPVHRTDWLDREIAAGLASPIVSVVVVDKPYSEMTPAEQTALDAELAATRCLLCDMRDSFHNDGCLAIEMEGSSRLIAEYDLRAPSALQVELLALPATERSAYFV